MLIDYSSAFNTIIPSRLISNLCDLGLGSKLCNWILSFLIYRQQSVRIGNCPSSTITLNTGAPQGCGLSTLLYSWYNHNYVAKFRTNAIYKFTDNTTIVGWIPKNDKPKYKRETEGLVTWCNEDNLSVNVGKTKELIIDFRKKGGEHTPIYINGTEVERVDCVKFLGVVQETWHFHKWHFLTKFYRCATVSILSGCMTAWYANCSAQDRKKLQREVCTAQTIMEANLQS
eukprot:g36942.t1